MKERRQINADAMLICFAFLVCAVTAAKLANASTGMKLALNTIQIVETTQKNLRQVMSSSAINGNCQQITQVKTKAGV